MYSPYGQPEVLHGVRDSSGTDTSASEWSARTSNTFENEVLYCGYRHDAETGLYHVRNRYYHPPLGRWASRDPIGHADGMGLYEYGLSSTLNARDPLGLRNLNTVEQKSVFNRILLEIEDQARPLAWYPTEPIIRAGVMKPKPLKTRAAWFVGEGIWQEKALGTIETVATAPAKAAVKASAQLVPGLSKAIDALDNLEDAKNAAEQLEALLERYHILQHETRGQGCLTTNHYSDTCRRKMIVVYDTHTDHFEGGIEGVVGDSVNRYGQTSCCNPEDFAYRFTGKVVWKYHGWWIFGWWSIEHIEVTPLH